VDKSFQTILEEHLNPRAAAPAAAFTPSMAFIANENPFASVTWTTRVQVKPKTAYAREKMLSQESAKTARRPKPEVLIALVKLSNEDLDRVRELVFFGAIELEEGLSVRRLKSAYRRLALRHHPDAAGGAGHESFLKIRAAYGQLLARLPAYA
jgi:hypothetical protein